MSNYPPGVTGSEYEIAGPDYEAEEQVRCGAEGAMVRSLTLTGWTRLQALTNAVAEQSRQGVMPESLNRFVFELRSLEAEVAEVDLAVCPYEGEQLVQGYQGVKWWVCPLCGTEHEEDFADE